jgi:beta-lactamase class D
MIVSLLLSATMPWISDAQLKRAFEGYEACFVMRDIASGETRRYNAAVSKIRFSPCSTFKIPNSLIALETGVARDEGHFYKWDGVVTPGRAAWNRDQTMATAMPNSVVWYYVRLAKDIGPNRMQTWINRLGYGNRRTHGDLKSPFWLDKTMAISADEQVAFLSKLVQGRLPASKRSTAIIEKITLASSGSGWRVNGKTGSGDGGGRPIGWYVGWVTKGGRQYAFACNIRGPKDAWGPKAKEITFGLLRQLRLIEGPAKDAPVRRVGGSRA